MSEKEAKLERKLTVQEVESISEEIASKEQMLKATGEFIEGGVMPALPQEVDINKSRLANDVKRLKEFRETQSAQRVTDPAKRQAIVNRRKELERQFGDLLETRQEIDVIKRDAPEFRQAVRKSLMRPKIEHLIHEWRELGKRLEPDDPEIVNLDNLRRDK